MSTPHIADAVCLAAREARRRIAADHPRLLIGVIGVMFTPVVHRMLHRFHWEEDDSSGG
jgi:hypothetical protein